MHKCDNKWRDSNGGRGKRESLGTAINSSPHTRQNLSKPLLQLLSTRTEPDPLDRPRSPHVASSHDLVDEPPCLTVRVQRPGFTVGTCACSSAHAVDISSQSARYVVLQDVCDTATGQSVQTAPGAIGGDRDDGVSRLRGAVGSVVGCLGEGSDEF